MSEPLVWGTMAAIGALTFLTRLSFVAAWGRFMPPPLLREALRYVPPAVLAAIVVPDVLMPGGALDLSPANPRLPAALVAALVAWRTRNALLTILAGALVFVAVRALAH
jgi:branched-subunit amino acid transport protein